MLEHLASLEIQGNKDPKASRESLGGLEMMARREILVHQEIQA